MRLVHDVKGVSKLILIILLLISFVFGALLSYVWTMGFYAPSEFHLPKQPTIVIENVAFNEQDASFFNVTVLNPSYSPSDALISRIEARTTDDNRIHTMNVSAPPTPYTLKRGESQEFKCFWNWANYTGIKLPFTDRPVEIRVFMEGNIGEIVVTKKPYVLLLISDVSFNSTISSNHFNITVRNMESSVTYVNVTSISVDVANITADMVTPHTLPYGLAPGDPAVTFTVAWNWTAYQNQSITIGVHTRQGYVHYLTTSP